MDTDNLNQLVRDCFPDVSVDKELSRAITAGERAIPAFVRDWLISRYQTDDGVDNEGIRDFLAKHLPDKQQREVLRNQLLNSEELVLLDGYSVRVDLNRGDRVLRIPSLDLENGHVLPAIVEQSPLLLSEAYWGAGRLSYRPSDSGGEVWMTEFRPMQTAEVDLDYFIDQRKRFDTAQWVALLIRSMGYNPDAFGTSALVWMLARLAPLAHPRVNILELAPKGTGKSYVFSQLSKYAWLISGGFVSRARLFFDLSRRQPGVITKFDAVILDEVQTIKLSGEDVIGALKGYLESGEFRVMEHSGNSEAGFVLLGNIPIGPDGKPWGAGEANPSYFDTLPEWLRGQQATALIDRFHGLIPGWELPRLHRDHFAVGLGLRADYLGEVLHALRQRTEYSDFVASHLEVDGDVRDCKAVERFTTAMLRLVFPDLKRVDLDDFQRLCVEPARQGRAMIRDQLRLMDPEYSAKPMTVQVVA